MLKIRSKKQLSIVDLVESRYAGLAEIAIFAASKARSCVSDIELANHLSSEFGMTDIEAAHLMVNSEFSKLLDKAITANTYTPVNRAMAIENIVHVATTRTTTKMNRAGDEVEVERDVKEIIMADTYLKEVMGTRDERRIDSSIRLIYEGITPGNASDEDVVDVEFSVEERHDNDYLTRQAKARQAIAQNFLDKRETELPPSDVVERYSDSNISKGDIANELFYSSDKTEDAEFSENREATGYFDEAKSKEIEDQKAVQNIGNDEKMAIRMYGEGVYIPKTAKRTEGVNEVYQPMATRVEKVMLTPDEQRERIEKAKKKFLKK